MNVRQPIEVVVNGSSPASVNATGVGIAERETADASQVFLSPRVVDRRAFSELAGELRKLVDRASGERASLSTSVAQASASIDAIRESESAQHSNLELAARALKRLDEKATRVQTLIDQATDASKLIEQFEARADRLLSTKLEAIEARIEASQSAAAAKVEALEQRLLRGTREMEQRIEAIRRDADAIVAPGLGALNDAIARATLVLGRSPTSAPDTVPQGGSLGDVVRRAEGVRDSADIALRQLEDIQTRASTSRSSLSAMLEDLSSIMERMDEQRASLASEGDRLAQQCAAAMSALEQRFELAKAQASQSIEDIKPQVQEASAEARTTMEQLRAITREALDAHNTTTLALRLADKSRDRLAQAIAGLEPWRGVLLDSSVNKALPAPLARIIEQVQGHFRSDLSSIATALRNAASSADRALLSVDANALESKMVDTPPPASPLSTITPTEPIVLGPGNLAPARLTPVRLTLDDPSASEPLRA